MQNNTIKEVSSKTFKLGSCLNFYANCFLRYEDTTGKDANIIYDDIYLGEEDNNADKHYIARLREH